MQRGNDWRVAIDQLYDAVGREQRLAQALGEFRPFFGAQGASFFTVADAARLSVAHTGAVGVSSQLLMEYHAHYSVHDEWVKVAVGRRDFGPGAVYRGQELMPLKDILQTYFGRQFLSRNEVVDVLSGVVETFPTDGAMSWVSFFRHRGEPAFSESDATQMAQLVPHTRQVLRLHRRLAPQLAVGATLRELIEQMDTPVVLVAEDGRIVDQNKAAQSALDDAPSVWLSRQGGRLHVRERARWQGLSSWMPALRSGDMTGLSLDLVSADGRCATLQVVPIQAALVDTVASHPAVAICCLKAGARDRSRAAQALFGLTATESRVAMQIVAGQSVAEIAAAMQISLSTVRTHIAAIRGKLGVSRQAQVVSALMSL